MNADTNPDNLIGATKVRDADGQWNVSESPEQAEDRRRANELLAIHYLFAEGTTWYVVKYLEFYKTATPALVQYVAWVLAGKIVATFKRPKRGLAIRGKADYERLVHHWRTKLTDKDGNALVMAQWAIKRTGAKNRKGERLDVEKDGRCIPTVAALIVRLMSEMTSNEVSKVRGHSKGRGRSRALKVAETRAATALKRWCIVPAFVTGGERFWSATANGWVRTGFDTYNDTEMVVRKLPDGGQWRETPSELPPNR